jgi:hypothetical protein
MRSYRLLATMSVMVVSLTVLYMVMNHTAGALDKSAVEMRRNLNSLSIPETAGNMVGVNSLLSGGKIPMPDENEARRLVISFTEELKNRYGGRTAEIRTQDGGKNSSGGSVVYKSSFNYFPENGDDVLKIISYFKNSVSPLIHISGVAFRSVRGMRQIEFEIEVHQPFTGGSYDY